MGRELYVLLMEVCILGTFSVMKYLEKEDIFGLIKNHMRDNGKKIKCMAMEC